MRPSENDLEPEQAQMPVPNRLENPDEWPGGWPQTVEQFERLVDIYLSRLVRSAYRRLGNLQDAEDVVQEVLVRVYAQRSDRQAISRVGPYLYRCVANACTDVLRKRSGDKRLGKPSDVNEIASGEQTPAQLVDMAEQCRCAESLLAQLPEQQAEVIRLRVYDGLRLREIADLLGCSTNTVCSRLRYGFQKLRRRAG